MRLCLTLIFILFSFRLLEAASLDKAEEMILGGNMLEAESICNRCLESPSCLQKDKAFYLLAEAQMEAKEYLPAREALRSLYKYYPNSPLRELAVIKIGDSHFLETNYDLAEKVYKFFLKRFPASGYKNMVYLRLAYAEEKLGKWDKKKYYMGLLKKAGRNTLEYPQINTLERRGFKFYIQIGAFLKKSNAARIADRLRADGFRPQIVHENSLYKVRVGSFSQRGEVEALAKNLAEKGYPFRIFP